MGNSFTYFNDLPKTFAALAKSRGDDVAAEMTYMAGFTLEKHLQRPATLQKIRVKPWDFVVLQEQSQSSAFPAEYLAAHVTPAALQLDQVIRQSRAGAKTAFFETWAGKEGDTANCANISELCAYASTQRRINATYADLAQRTSAILAPVGEAWSAVRRAHPEIELYNADGVHPSPLGSYLAACVLYESLFKKSAIGADTLGLDPGQAKILQQAADAALFGAPAAP